MVRNADITLYHKEYDPTKRIDVWTHAQYEGVSWHGRQAATVGDNGLNTADAYTVRIFTRAAAVASGDIIIRGLVDFDDPQKARRAAAASFLVTSVADNRRGPDHMQHWRIEGK